MMPLSEHEKVVLEEIERFLHRDDPRFADSMESERSGRQPVRRLVTGLLCAVCGFLLLLVGAYIQAVPLGVAGFVMMVAGAHQASLGVGPSRFRVLRRFLRLPGKAVR
jgi:hypothetical protein